MLYYGNIYIEINESLKYGIVINCEHIVIQGGWKLMNLKQSKSIKIIIIIIDIMFCLIFPLSVVGAIVSPMTFDAPGSTENFYNWVFFLTAFSIPIVILISVITSLLFLFKLKSYKKALLFSLLPIINFTIIYLISWIATFQK